ncbi:MAG TPA: DUF1223 domain-containing protein [Caulobacteraceae bacterium]|nr:DUF1223 domain-containing protein [Caulobacteraceae bacterium]
MRLLSGIIAALAVAGGAIAQPSPVVVELYQSQGCSSCPPADANVNALADRPGVLVLSFGVTYWDDLGWRDTFADPAYTRRQWDYAHGLHHAEVATPEVVIDGRRDLVGNDPRELAAAIRAAGAPSGATLALGPGRVVIGAGRAPAGGADVWLVRYDPRTLNVAVKRGENGGKTLPHRNVVRSLVRVGRWTGASVGFAVPKADPVLKTAILVQAANGGPILAAQVL